MAELQNRIRTKNEATGIRVVGQFVQEFWECGWQPYDARNDKGIDGLILMHKKGQDLGVKINVQVKCGAKYITSINENEIRISIDNEKGFEEHLKYWRSQVEPAILVFVNPCKPQRDNNGNILTDEKGKIKWIESRIKSEAWWVDLKDKDLQPENTKTILRLNRKSTFGEHSKGDFLKLIKPLLSISHLPTIKLNKESKNLLYSLQLKKDAREFYKNWKNGNSIICQALGQEIKVSRTGWRHILLNRRGKERRNNSLQLLGVAKQIIDEVDKFYLLTQREERNLFEQKLGLRAVVKDTNQGDLVVQVIILRRLNKTTDQNKWWFYSVHYRR